MNNIIKSLNNCPSHRSHGSKTCKSISLIEEYINNKNVLTGEIFDHFIATLSNSNCIETIFWMATALKYVKNMQNTLILPKTFKYFTNVPIEFLQNIYNIQKAYKDIIHKLVLEYYNLDTITHFLPDISLDNDNICLLLKNTRICVSECKYLLNLRAQTTKQNLPSEVLHNCFKNNTFVDNTEILDLLLFIGCSIDEQVICYLCEKGKYDILKRLLHGNIIITDNMYNAVHKIYRYDGYDVLKIKALIIDLLIENNYVITQFHIKDSILKKYYINNINQHLQKCNMTHDEIYDLQKSKNATKCPYIIVNSIMIPNLLYYATINNKNLQFIIQVIAITNIIPDLEYLENACNYGSTYEIIEYVLHKYNLDITKKCLINASNTGYGSRILSVLLKKIPDGIIKCIQNGLTKNKLDQESVNNNTINNTNNNTNNNSVKILKLGKPSNFPKNTKIKNKVSDECVKLLKLRSEMVSFLDLKKKALDYVKSNFLLEQNYVKINKNLSNLINVEENSCIQFTDFDNIVAYFIEN